MLICIFGASITFFFGSVTYNCREEVVDISPSDTSKETIGKLYCKVFRHSQEQNVYPSPEFFVWGANAYYRSFNLDYVNGDVALFGETRISAFRAFIGVEYPEVNYLKTEYGWYSIDGNDKDHCVMELGQVESPQTNYRKCLDREMDRDVFSN